MGITTEWATLTPTFYAAGGSPAVGNGELEFNYRRVDGQLTWKFFFEIGSTTNLGSGLWVFTVAAENDFPTNAEQFIYETPPAPAFYYDASAAVASRFVSGVALCGWGTAYEFLDVVGIAVIEFLVAPVFGSARLSATAPVTPAAGDRIVCGNAIEALNT